MPLAPGEGLPPPGGEAPPLGAWPPGPGAGADGGAICRGAPFSKASNRRSSASGEVSSWGEHSFTKAISSSARWLA